ncbi:MAG TPA: hypothetical protein DCR95_08665 [Desulfobacter sp.]|nr:hypothetical protein [Desulfobacter sp.]
MSRNISFKKQVLMVGLLFLFSGILNESRCDDNWPPEGKGKRFEVTRDTGISSVGREKNGNCGGSWKVKLKGQQEFVLFDIDPKDLRGKIITGAVLYFNTSASKSAPILRTGVSSVAGRWEEGFLFRYLPLPGASCFNQAGYKVQDWAYPGSSLMDVVFGHGHTLMKRSASRSMRKSRLIEQKRSLFFLLFLGLRPSCLKPFTCIQRMERRPARFRTL